MTIEEKAKAYDEVLERVKPLYEWAKKDDSPMWSTYEYLFPQLAESESEDDRIRRALIDGVRQIRCKNGVTQEQMLAYLEKQKEPENISASTMIPSFHEELTEFELVLFNAVLDNNFVGAKGSENALAMTKKVAPELLAIAKKEPDWDRKKCFVCQEYEKGFKQGHLEGCTAGYNKAMKEVDEQKEPHFTKRNALFDKCVENCNPEVMKKVSDEIDEMLQKEQKPAECNANDKAFIKDCAHILDENGYAASAERLLSMFPIKPAEWSEGDKKLIDGVINSLCCYQNTLSDYQKEIVGEEIRKLKSLKPQPKQEWSEEEKDKLNSIERIIVNANAHGNYLIGDKEAIDLQHFIRSIVKPTTNLAEWNEEDRLHYTNVLEALKYVKGCKFDYDKIEAVKSDIAWFKSLRNRQIPSDNWKPSDEQMRCLKIACENRREKHNASVNGDDVFLGLASLYNLLKKLM